MGYTPGPWITDCLNHVWREYRDDLGRLCKQPIAEIVCVAAHEPEQAPNAHLVAAALEMLKACKMALTDLEPYEWTDLVDSEEAGGYAVKATIDQLRIAIAKAKGDA